MVLTVCLKAGLATHSWTWVTHCAIWGSVAMWFLFILLYRSVLYYPEASHSYNYRDHGKNYEYLPAVTWNLSVFTRDVISSLPMLFRT